MWTKRTEGEREGVGEREKDNLLCLLNIEGETKRETEMQWERKRERKLYHLSFVFRRAYNGACGLILDNLLCLLNRAGETKKETEKQ